MNDHNQHSDRFHDSNTLSNNRRSLSSSFAIQADIDRQKHLTYSGQGKSKSKEKSKQSAKCKGAMVMSNCNLPTLPGWNFLCQHETFGLCPLKGSKNLHSPGWMAAPIPPVHNQTGRTGKVGSEIWIWWGAVIWIWFKLDFWWHGPIRYHYHRLLEKIKMGRKGSHRKPIPQTNRNEFRNTAQKLQYSCMHGHVIWDWLSNISWSWKEI